LGTTYGVLIMEDDETFLTVFVAEKHTSQNNFYLSIFQTKSSGT
jgi:hypothetical protein